MTVSPPEIETFLPLLAATPNRIAAATRDVENTRLHSRADENTWSANDILAHLRVCAELWTKSMIAMLEQDHPTLRYVSPRTWINKTNYRELDFHESFAAFAAQRSELLKLLGSLSIQQWSRGVDFTGNTQGRNHNVFTYMRRMAQHENEHCAQIEALLRN